LQLSCVEREEPGIQRPRGAQYKTQSAAARVSRGQAVRKEPDKWPKAGLISAAGSSLWPCRSVNH